MFDVLSEIIVPLIISFGLGLEVGWLLWRWRRRPISADEWDRLELRATSAEAQLADLHADLQAAAAGQLSPN